jgi:hypothetical protein
MDEARIAHCEFVLPVDVVVAKQFAEHAASRVVDIDHVGDWTLGRAAWNTQGSYIKSGPLAFDLPE